YHPSSIPLINERIDSVAAKGRNPLPRRVKMATPTLKYNRQAWVTVEGLGKHWDVARVDAEIVDDRQIRAATENVTAVTFSMSPGFCPLDESRPPAVLLDNQRLTAAPVMSDRSWRASFRRRNGRWESVPALDDGVLRKRHDLQGPIDDAFMESFMIVRPTGEPLATGVAAWV